MSIIIIIALITFATLLALSGKEEHIFWVIMAGVWLLPLANEDKKKEPVKVEITTEIKSDQKPKV
jgi:hypothetical protein